ncbi:hypothetical protein DY000_02005776, partial [Brassica cretica]
MHFSVVFYMFSVSKIIDRYKLQQADDLHSNLGNLAKTIIQIFFGVPCYTKPSQDFQPFPIFSFRVQDLEEKTRNYLPHKKLLELVQSNLEEANVDGTKLMMEFVNTRKEKEKLLIEENLVLASKVTEIWKQRFLVTRDETSMLPEYSSGNNPPETLSLL